VRHRTRSTGTREDLSSFDTKFWPRYPKHTAKKAAERAFNRIQPDDALLAQMLASLDAQKAGVWREHVAKGGDALRFIPHAATWLNGERWTDVVPAAAAAHHVDQLEQHSQAFIAARQAKLQARHAGVQVGA
jgi:hypothetical protein